MNVESGQLPVGCPGHAGRSRRPSGHHHRRRCADPRRADPRPPCQGDRRRFPLGRSQYRLGSSAGITTVADHRASRSALLLWARVPPITCRMHWRRTTSRRGWSLAMRPNPVIVTAQPPSAMVDAVSIFRPYRAPDHQKPGRRRRGADRRNLQPAQPVRRHRVGRTDQERGHRRLPGWTSVTPGGLPFPSTTRPPPTPWPSHPTGPKFLGTVLGEFDFAYGVKPDLAGRS